MEGMFWHLQLVSYRLDASVQAAMISSNVINLHNQNSQLSTFQHLRQNTRHVLHVSRAVPDFGSG